ncbi:MAG: SHOCT domain-containing protein [Oscillospiraceae bacterium]|nr:SHOCT domain-containing protein [Oscillospiraceae bacterium]
MDNQASIYSEKKLAYYETVYKETILSKPQEISLTVTAEHIFGIAYICDQTGTMENDPVYTRYSCGLEEITKVYVNTNNKLSPIYIQCDDNSKGVVNRRRIILPNFDNNDEIVALINTAKKDCDQKINRQREIEKNKKIQELESRRKAMDDEFDSLTSGYEDYKKSVKPQPAPAPAPAAKPEPKPAPAPAPAPEKEGSVTVDDILGIDDLLGISAASASSPEAFMEPVESEPDDAEIENIPEEILQKKPADIEEISIPEQIPEKHAKKEVKPAPAEIEELNTTEEIAKRLTPKASRSNPKPAPAPAPAPAEPKQEEIIEPETIPQKVVENMSLEEFELAVKKLKTMLDNGVISESEFAVEKKKLLANLY